MASTDSARPLLEPGYRPADIPRPRREHYRTAATTEKGGRIAALHRLRVATRSRREQLDMALAAMLRPRTRAECVDGPRPCPWVGCRYHLFLDVLPGGGLRKHPSDDPLKMEHTCVLDLTERGRLSLEAVGDLLGYTRERTRQIEEIAVAKVRQAAREIAREAFSDD